MARRRVLPAAVAEIIILLVYAFAWRFWEVLDKALSQ